MDTTYHSNIPIETLSLLDCDVRNFDFIHPIKNIFFDNIEYIRKLDASGKARPCILDNVERSLLCHTCYLGFDQFECTDCDNWNIIPHSCHSRFCNACGVKYAKQLAAKATSFCLDCPHRHIVFTIPELIYSFKKDKIKTFHHFNFIKLRKTFQFELIRLIQEAGGLKKPEEKNRLYKDHPKGFYVYAKFKSPDNASNDASSNKNSKDIQGCVNYFIRYAGRPAMAENRITEYNKGSKTVSWFYNDHKDEKRHDVTDNVIDFINRLIIHIPDYHFLTTRYYGFYANASKKTLDKVHALLGIKKNKDYSRETRTKALKNKLNKLKYRTHYIDSFNRDPIQCKCGAIMQYTYTYNPLEDKRNDRTYRKRCIDEMYKMRLRRRST